MRSFEASAAIDADANAVWSVLIDGAAWSSWDSGVAGLDGRLAAGERVTIRSKAAPRRAFPVTVSVFEAPDRMVLEGGMPLGLFRGVRTYDLATRSDGTDFRMREEYSGPLVGLMWRSMPDLGSSFQRFALGLKRRVEEGV